MARPRGTSRKLSLSRRMICDFLRASRGRPLIPIERRMKLAPLVVARESNATRPSWCTIFLKAYSIVAARRPELRTAYLSFLRSRLYEHPDNLAAVIFEREFAGEQFLLPAVVHRPEELPIAEIDTWMRRCKNDPVDSIGSFRRGLRVGRLPWPLRQLAWLYGTNWSGMQKARFLGTFGISVTAGQGAETLSVITPWTTTLHYGRFEPNGDIPVRVTFDHRVLDGAAVARALVDLEETLMTNILAELQQRANARAA